MNWTKLICLILAPLAMTMPARQSFASDAAVAVNGFAFGMYSELSSGSGNIFFSPYSVSSAMAMLYAGASGEAEREIRSVMGYPEAAHRAIRGLREILEAGGDLAVANAIWPDAGFAPLPSYVATIREYYGGDVTQFDYRTEWREAEDAINRWTDIKTEGMIKRVLDRGALKPQDDTETAIVLTNAVYFFSRWRYPFPAKDTAEGTFFGGAEKNMEFMTQINRFPYYETELFQLVTIPYESGKFSMTVVLPKERDGINSLESGMTFGKFLEWRASSRVESVNIRLPKFELEWEKDLADDFKALGLRSAFSLSRDNYSNMTADRTHTLKVSRIIHKARARVSESGTEASAVTAIGMVRVTAALNPPKEFNADHPFIFFITNDDAETILFMGRCVNPGETGRGVL